MFRRWRDSLPRQQKDRNKKTETKFEENLCSQKLTSAQFLRVQRDRVPQSELDGASSVT